MRRYGHTGHTGINTCLGSVPERYGLPDPLRDGAILLPLLGKLLLDPEGLQGRHSNVFSSEKQTINI